MMWSPSRGHFLVDKIPAQWCGLLPGDIFLWTLLQVYILWTFGCSCGQSQCFYYSTLSVPFLHSIFGMFFNGWLVVLHLFIVLQVLWSYCASLGYALAFNLAICVFAGASASAGRILTLTNIFVRFVFRDCSYIVYILLEIYIFTLNCLRLPFRILLRKIDEMETKMMKWKRYIDYVFGGLRYSH